MKRILMIMLIATSILMLVGAASAQDEECVWAANTTVDLIAGQNMDAGSVTVKIIGDDLVVTYYAEGDWLLYETQLNVSVDPITNHAPGQFPYKHENLGGVDNDTYIIPLSEFGLSNPCECVDCEESLYIASHALVKKLDNGDVVQEETAWGEGQCIYDTCKPWAMYFEVPLTCECDDPGNPQGEIPEFPTIALPVAAILGLAFLFQRRKE